MSIPQPPVIIISYFQFSGLSEVVKAHNRFYPSAKRGIVIIIIKQTVDIAGVDISILKYIVEIGNLPDQGFFVDICKLLI